MPKNKGLGGKRFKKGKKGAGLDKAPQKTPLKGQDQDYAYVSKMLGDRRIMVALESAPISEGTKQEVMAKIPGSMRKRVWINVGDWVLVNIREFQEGRVDVVYKYTPNDVRLLVRKKHIKHADGLDTDMDGDEDKVVFQMKVDDTPFDEAFASRLEEALAEREDEWGEGDEWGKDGEGEDGEGEEADDDDSSIGDIDDI
jgi:translation initiation factor 1A